MAIVFNNLSAGGGGKTLYEHKLTIRNSGVFELVGVLITDSNTTITTPNFITSLKSILGSSGILHINGKVTESGNIGFAYNIMLDPNSNSKISIVYNKLTLTDGVLGVALATMSTSHFSVYDTIREL